MKQRNGFVSNSSSSSFVVVFPRKPRSQKDVFKMMFGNHENLPSFVSDTVLSTEEAARIVWVDLHRTLKSGKSGKLLGSRSIGEIADDFVPRYFYLRDNGRFGGTSDDFYASNKKLFDELAIVTQEHFKFLKQAQTKLHDWVNRNIPSVSYNQPGFSEYSKKASAFQNTDATCIRMRAKFDEQNQKHHAKMSELRTKLAMEDAIAFTKALRKPGAYIARLSYSDGDGPKWSLMEHGGVFDQLPHVQISHH
jgi:hypothetical protein